MKSISTWLVLALSCAALNAHAENNNLALSPQTAVEETASSVHTPADKEHNHSHNPQIDGKTEVAYLCESGAKEKIALTAMYGFKNNDVVVAQIRLSGQISPGMWRVSDHLLNRFVGKDDNSLQTMWTTLPANAQTIRQVNGGTLSYFDEQRKEHVVIVENCKLNHSATAKLN